jgi:transposase
MLFVGIDVAKNAHECFIMDSDGVVFRNGFSFPNTRDGFDSLLKAVMDCGKPLDSIKVGLESTGHYSFNLAGFLKQSGFKVVTFNPLQVNLYRKAVSLRKTKTDKNDARFIAEMLVGDNSQSYLPVSYHISELKSLTRHRFRLVGYRARLKIQLSRLFDIVFPELPSVVWSVNQSSVYALALQLPNPAAIAACNLTKLTNILFKGSKGHYGKDKATEIKELAKRSIGNNSPAVAFELQQTVRLIQNVTSEIDILEDKIIAMMKEINSPIMQIKGISYVLAAMILAEIGNIHNFATPSKLLAFAGCEPSTYQSGKFTASNTPMVKRGSAYLRYAILTAAKLVAIKCPAFSAYLNKKQAEGKHYFVALSHTGKKLVRVIFHLLKTNAAFNNAI